MVCFIVFIRVWWLVIIVDGRDDRDGADVVEIIGFVDVSRWLVGMWVIVRREEFYFGV